MESKYRDDGNGAYWDGTPEEEQVYLADPARIVSELTAALESHYDAAAQQRSYDNRFTCALRAGYLGPFQSEGVSFAVWMDTCNAYAYTVMAAVQAGTRLVPTTTELISELPVLVWEA